MIETRRYRPDELPLSLELQIRSFMRVTWPQLNVATRPIAPPDCNPVYHVVTDGAVLISHAMVTEERGQINGRDYRMLGMGTVFTYPDFREKGFGGQVVGAATESMLQAGSADFGMLFTPPERGALFARHGWQSIELDIAIGSEKPIELEDTLMVHPLNGEWEALEHLLEGATLRIQPHSW